MPTVQPQRQALRAAEVERQRQAYFDSLSGGAGGSSNQGTDMADVTTSAQILRQAPFLEEFQRRLLDQAFLRGETPVDIPDIEVAGLDPLTQQAIAAGQGIGQFQDYLTQGAGTIGQGLATLQERTAGVPGLFAQAAEQAAGTGERFVPTAAGLQPYLDPYQQLVTQEALGEYQRQADIQRNQLAAQAVQAGAFGGSRFGIQGAELDRNLADIKSRRIFEDLSRNFSQAQNAASTAFENQQKRQQGISQLLAGVGQIQSQEGIRASSGIGAFGTQQANLAGLGQGLVGEEARLLSQLGSVGQTQAQRELDALRQSQLQQSYEPFQRVGFMGDIFKPSIGSAASTLGVVTAPSPSPLSQAIGVGVGAFGLNRALDNPFGNLFGTGTD